MRIVAHRERCISSGNCVLTAPKLFDQDEEGVVVVRVAEPAAEDEAQAREAVLACPVIALELKGEGEGW
jgi:ferredoxin